MEFNYKVIEWIENVHMEIQSPVYKTLASFISGTFEAELLYRGWIAPHEPIKPHVVTMDLVSRMRKGYFVHALENINSEMQTVPLPPFHWTIKDYDTDYLMKLIHDMHTGYDITDFEQLCEKNVPNGWFIVEEPYEKYKDYNLKAICAGYMIREYLCTLYDYMEIL
jgi:hypothetical protein